MKKIKLNPRSQVFLGTAGGGGGKEADMGTSSWVGGGVVERGKEGGGNFAFKRTFCTTRGIRLKRSSLLVTFYLHLLFFFVCVNVHCKSNEVHVSNMHM